MITQLHICTPWMSMPELELTTVAAVAGFASSAASWTRTATVAIGCAALLLVAAGALLNLQRPEELERPERKQTILLGAATIGIALVLGLLFAGEVSGAAPVQVSALLLALVSIGFGAAGFHHAWSNAASLVARPSRRDLQRQLSREQKVLNELKARSGHLQDRVQQTARQVEEIKRRFEFALRGSPITVYSQDRDLRYLWIHNPPAGIRADEIVGRTDLDVVGGEAATRLMDFKRRVLDSRRSDRLEVKVESPDFGERWFDVVAEPYDGGEGEHGLLCVSVEITTRKRREDQLRGALREMSHRSKNLLSVLLGVARQTANSSTDVDAFMDAFSSRLLAMSITQDLLVEQNWGGVRLDRLIAGQAAPFQDEAELPLVTSGPAVILRPEPAQNLGLAIHELVRTAARSNTATRAGTRLDARWSLNERELVLEWCQSGITASDPPELDEFGSMVLTSMVPRALDGTSLIKCEPGSLRVIFGISQRNFVRTPLEHRAERDV